MINLNFKNWLEVMTTTPPEMVDPNLAAIGKQAKNAAQMAIKSKKNPIAAAQQAVLASNIPTNQLGKVLPKDQDQIDA